MDTEEMLRFQGIDIRSLSGHEKGIRCKEFNAAIGYAMSANILERLLPRVAFASGCLSTRPEDPWRSTRFVNEGARFKK